MLWKAAKANNLKGVKTALSEGGDPNTFRVPSDNGTSVEFRTIHERQIEHHNDNDQGSALNLHNDYVSAMMVAAQHNNIPMLLELLAAGGNINLAQPVLTYADGLVYGGMTVICYALFCPETTKWCLDNGADIDITIHGLPGYEEIPCQNFSPLLIASVIANNESVCHLLTEAGDDVNHGAERNNGYQGGDTTVCCYWRDVVASGNVSWAERLITEFNAEVSWPSDRHIRNVDIKWPGSHNGFGASVLLTAVSAKDIDMSSMLLKHEADPNQCEHVNFFKGMEAMWVAEDAPSSVMDILRPFEQLLACPLSVALGNAGIPDNMLLYDDAASPTTIVGVHASVGDPMITLLLKAGAKCSITAARTVAQTEEEMKQRLPSKTDQEQIERAMGKQAPVQMTKKMVWDNVTKSYQEMDTYD